MPLEIEDQHADPSDTGEAGPKERDGGASDFQIVVNGKAERFDLNNPEDLEELKRRAQFGTNYSQKAAALNARELQLQRDLKPILDFDEIVKNDQDIATLTACVVNGRAIPPDLVERLTDRGLIQPQNGHRQPPDDDDEDVSRVVSKAERRVMGRVEQKEQGLGRVINQVLNRVEQMERRDQERSEVATLKSSPQLRGWVTDDHIAAARQRAKDHGGSIEDNFKILYFDEIQKVAMKRVTADLPADVRRTMLTRDTGAIVIDGVRITEEKLQELRDNPDEYAKVRKHIRAAKRRARNQIAYPGRE
jgi:hypothetical protein